MLKDKMTQELKKLLAANMLCNGLTAALAVIVPLYLLDKKIDMGVIGLILAIGPITFMIMRIMFASVADSLGTKIISLSYSVLNIIAVLLYIVSTTLLGFSAAEFIEGLRTSAFWAVNRSEALAESDRDNEVMAFFSGMRQLADSLGRLSGGLLIGFLAFQNAFLAVLALSAILLFVVLSYKKGGVKSPHIGDDLVERMLKPHPPTFWYATILLLGIILLPNVFLSFVIPVYAHAQLGMDYSETGIMIALFSFVMAAATLVMTRYHYNIRHLLYLSLLAVPGLLILPFVGQNIAIPLIIIGFACGCSGILAEYILVDQIYRSKDVSTDIGVLFIPLKAVEGTFYAVGGFVISNFGYLPLLVFLALTMVMLFVLGMPMLKRQPHHS